MPEFFKELREAIDVNKGYDIEKIEKAYWQRTYLLIICVLAISLYQFFSMFVL